MGTWAVAYPRFALSDSGYYVNQAHNDWAQWLAEGGVPLFLLMLGTAALTARPALESGWGIGPLAVYLHCLVDYPMHQRPALAAWLFVLTGAVAARSKQQQIRGGKLALLVRSLRNGQRQPEEAHSSS